MSFELIRKLPFNHPYRYDGSKFGAPTLWTPDAITTNGWWDAYDEDTITTVTGVSNWADKSGNGYDWTQGSTSAQPAYGSRTLKGLKVLDFNGSTHGMVGSGYNLSGKNSMVFMVADMDAVTDWTGPIAQDSGETIRYGLYNESGAVSQARFQQSGIATRAMSTGINLISGYNNGSNTYAGLNGEYTVGAAPATFSTSYRYLGFALDGFGGTTDFLDAGVGEIIIVDSYNDTTRQIIEGYLAHKWGLESSLPADHPFRFAPPDINGVPIATLDYIGDWFPMIGSFAFRKTNPRDNVYCVKVREAGGDTLADIPYGDDGWIDQAALAAHCGANHGYLHTWYNPHYLGEDLLTTVNANQPKIYDSATGIVKDQNGNIALQFNGTSNRIADEWAEYFAQPFSILAVGGQRIAATPARLMMDSYTNGNKVIINNGTGSKWYWGGDPLRDSGDASDANIHLFTKIYNGASSVFRLDKSQIDTGDVGSFAFNSMHVGASKLINSFWDGYVSEIHIIHKDITDDLDVLENYITNALTV